MIWDLLLYSLGLGMLRGDQGTSPTLLSIFWTKTKKMNEKRYLLLRITGRDSRLSNNINCMFLVTYLGVFTAVAF